MNRQAAVDRGRSKTGVAFVARAALKQTFSPIRGQPVLVNGGLRLMHPRSTKRRCWA
ncbi:hypothetical protein RHECNPAF_2190057 [Rhizobium etli CNPAF512]|nr:hypothetical protein RHECNPAF_2190057 [Rhizobium etli CNPAF512]